MGTCLSRQVTYATAELNWQVLLFETEPYYTLVCAQCCSTSDGGVLSETCRSGWRIGRNFLSMALQAERFRHWTDVEDVNGLLKHFNMATELSYEDTPDGCGIACFEFQSGPEAAQFIHDVTDFQRRWDTTKTAIETNVT